MALLDSPNSVSSPLKCAELPGVRKNLRRSLTLVFEVTKAFINAEKGRRGEGEKGNARMSFIYSDFYNIESI